MRLNKEKTQKDKFSQTKSAVLRVKSSMQAIVKPN